MRPAALATAIVLFSEQMGPSQADIDLLAHDMTGLELTGFHAVSSDVGQIGIGPIYLLIGLR